MASCCIVKCQYSKRVVYCKETINGCHFQMGPWLSSSYKITWVIIFSVLSYFLLVPLVGILLEPTIVVTLENSIQNLFWAKLKHWLMALSLSLSWSSLFFHWIISVDTTYILIHAYVKSHYITIVIVYQWFP